MDQLIKLVRTYRLTGDLAARARLAADIISAITPDLRYFIFGSVPVSDGDDVLQNVVKTIVSGLHKFEGDAEKQFWGWCYKITRYKISDYFREKKSDRLTTLPPEELQRLIDVSAASSSISPSLRGDLDYVMNMLAKSKPDCFELLWRHYLFDEEYYEIAEAKEMTYDNTRIKIRRCIEAARKFID